MSTTVVLNYRGWQRSNVAERAIMCAGHVNWDVVLHTTAVPDPDYSSEVIRDHSSSGGSSTNTALALASLGRDVTMFGSVGDDEYGERAVETLRENGVEPATVETEVPTTLVYAIITEDADPRYLARDEAVGSFGVEDVPEETWERVDHVHVTTFDREIAGELAQAANEAGKTVSFNPTQRYANERFDEVVDAADVIFLNEREANIFRNRRDLDAAIEEACIVMTHGAAGSTAYTPHGVVNHSGFDSGELVDTIGAGDAFVAGFLDEWLCEDDEYPDIERALSQANACGSYSVTRPGAPDGVDPDVIRRFIEGE